MLSGWTIGLSLIGILALALGLLVITRDWRKPVNMSFMVLSVAVSLWVFGIAGFLSASTDEHAFFFAKLFYAAPLIIVLMLTYFSYLFPIRAKLPLRVWLPPLVPIGSLLLLLCIFPSFITDSIQQTAWGRQVEVNQFHYFLYAITIISLFVQSFYLIYRRTKALTGLYREQARWFLVAGALSAVVGAWFNIVLAHWLGDYRFVWAGPLATTLYIVASSISIVRHKMFDIKLAAVRTLAYSMSVLVMASIYFVFAYLVSVTLFSGTVTTGVSFSPINVVLALILAFIFQPVKQFFDRVTDQLFYRDRYDANEFITRLGRVLTSTTRLHDVIEKAGNEIATTLKAGGSMIVVYRDNHADAVAGWRMKNLFTDEEHDQLKAAATHFGGGLLVVESLQRIHTHEARRLYALLAKRNVAVVLPLVTVDETIGYLLLEEQMGGGYAKRDLEVLEAIADSLVIAIQNARSVQVVRDLNTHLEQRVSAATRELRATNKRLIELDATKDEFVSMASHQLRTPLTSIKGYLSMVLEGDVGDITPDQRQLLGEAFTSSERMVHLIGDFLNVSRLQTGKFMIEYRETDLAKLVEQEVESMRQIAGSHDKKIVYRVPQVFPRLFIDDNKLRQVVMNFIDNAIYYSPDSRAPITVRLVVEDGFAVMTVTDKGMGVPAEVQKQLFTKFFRAENARKQRPDGTGIGLYLARRIIDSHGGKLIFESVEGKGSTFGFRLPIKRLSQPPQLAE